MTIKRLSMTRIEICLVLFLLLQAIGLLTTSNFASENIEFKSTQVQIKGKSYALEIAQTGSQRRQGLMYRTSLAAYSGMLFIYPRPGYHRIWMKNTLIPLTVIWIDDNDIVIGVEKLQPCTADPCPSYGVGKPSSYVIELDWANNELQVGDRVSGLRRLFIK